MKTGDLIRWGELSVVITEASWGLAVLMAGYCDDSSISHWLLDCDYHYSLLTVCQLSPLPPPTWYQDESSYLTCSVSLAGEMSGYSCLSLRSNPLSYWHHPDTILTPSGHQVTPASLHYLGWSTREMRLIRLQARGPAESLRPAGLFQFKTLLMWLHWKYRTLIMTTQHNTLLLYTSYHQSNSASHPP